MGERVTFRCSDDGVGVVTLTRPEKRNALDQATFQGLYDAAEAARSAAAEGRCSAVLVRGEGAAFCSGLDTSLFAAQAAGDLPQDEWIAWLQGAFTAFEDLPVVTVAALHGAVLGGGLQLALACHLRVAAPDASLGLLEVRWGLVPDLGGTYRLPRVVGLGRATDLAVSGRQIDAATAHAWGLVDVVLADQDPLAAAHAYAARLAAGPPLATGQIPRLLREHLVADRSRALAAERAAQQRCLASADFGEAVAASLQGRPPRFTGR